MKKSHIAMELALIESKCSADKNLLDFYIKVRHLSKRNAYKKVLNWSDEEFDRQVELAKKEKFLVSQMLNKMKKH